jgi:GAF domain-containing protein
VEELKGRWQMDENVSKYYMAIYDVAKAMNSTLNDEEVLRTIVEGAATATNAKGCALMLLSPDRKLLRHAVSYGLSEWYLRKGPVSVDISIAEALKGNAVEVLNAPEDDRIQYREEAKEEGIASILCVPVMLRDEVIGVIRLYTTEQRHFSMDDIYFLGAVATLGAIALEKARLYQSLKKNYESLTEPKEYVLEPLPF